MDIRSGLDGLKTLLGVTPATPGGQRTEWEQTRAEATLSTDSATLSTAGSEVALAAADGGVRPDKVTAVQAALAAGTYEVPAAKVAAKIVGAMLERGE